MEENLTGVVAHGNGGNRGVVEEGLQMGGETGWVLACERRDGRVGDITRRGLSPCLKLNGNPLAGEAACQVTLALRVRTVLPGEERNDNERPQRHCQKGGACVFDLQADDIHNLPLARPGAVR